MDAWNTDGDAWTTSTAPRERSGRTKGLKECRYRLETEPARARRLRLETEHANPDRDGRPARVKKTFDPAREQGGSVEHLAPDLSRYGRRRDVLTDVDID